jgi:hypothetical protein
MFFCFQFTVVFPSWTRVLHCVRPGATVLTTRPHRYNPHCRVAKAWKVRVGSGTTSRLVPAFASAVGPLHRAWFAPLPHD